MRRRAWLVCWAASMALVAIAVGRGAEILGMHVAGTIWRASQVSWPLLGQTGEVLGGLLGGTLAAGVQWALLRPWKVRARWIGSAALAGLGVGLSGAVYAPLPLLAAPVAAGVAAFAQTRLLPRPALRWVRAQAIATAWCALAFAMPFAPAAALLLVLAAAALSAWGIDAALPTEPRPSSDGLAAPAIL